MDGVALFYGLGAGEFTVTATTDTFRLVHDAAPPAVWLEVPRRVYSGSVSIPLAWGAVDRDSGVAHYDLDVRIEEGAWQPVLTHTTSTRHRFPLPPGSYFAFRLTATDNVGNAGRAEAASSLARVTKYYYHGGQRVAMRADGVVYYLHGDHLGSTSLTTDASRAVVARQLYHPYGTVRHSDGTLPTDFGFGGQRHDSSTGLVFMHARYYHAGLGRFVSADTIVPDPGNPQDFNRYAYVRNSPLRYSDPTGFFSEEEIMRFFDAETWEEVLANFEADGYLEGRWGWLEVLRRAEVGDEVAIANKHATVLYATATRWNDGAIHGTFTTINDMLYIRSDIVQGDFVPHDLAALSGSYYRIGAVGHNLFITPADAMHPHFDPSKVDWIDVGLDGGGLLLDLLACGIPGRVLNGGKAIKGAGKIGNALNVVGVVKGTHELTLEDVSWVDWMSLGLDGMGFFVPLGPDAVGLMFDFGKAFSP